MSPSSPPIWRRFVRASLATGLSAGFGLGGLLFVTLLGEGGAGSWWPAAAQAHGHAQVFGWAGLMVLGVGVHFLPRLASAPPPRADLTHFGFWVVIVGLSARVVCQVALGFTDGGTAADILGAGWAAGSVAELAGALLILGLLAGSMRAALPLRPDAAIRPILPLLAAAMLGLVAYLTGSALLAFKAVSDDAAWIAPERSARLSLIGLYGFLVPISVAMSIRIFPLYFRTPPARVQLTRGGVALLLAGLLLRLAGDEAALDTAGRWLLLGGAMLTVAGARVFEPRRPLPRRKVWIWQDAPGLHALGAYLWLLAAGLAALGGERWAGLELHLLGAGFVTLLILGSGVHLLPGFARARIRTTRLVWATLALGNLAVLCRAAPAFPPLHLDPDIERTLGAAAGLCGLAALTLFALNLRDALTGTD